MDCSGRRSEGEERWNGDSSDVLLLPAARVAGSGTGCVGGGGRRHIQLEAQMVENGRAEVSGNLMIESSNSFFNIMST
jgi:hypothetical protein